MIRFVTALLLSFSTFAQVSTEQESPNYIKDESKYVSLQDNKVFDVEIIVFAYRTQLPNNKTYSNKAIYDDSKALNLQYKPENLAYIINTDQVTNNQPEIEEQEKEYTVSINDEENKNQALVWFEHSSETYKLTGIWKRLLNQQNIVPIVHRAWRQAETAFNDPVYVNIKPVSLQKTDLNTSLSGEINGTDASLDNVGDIIDISIYSDENIWLTNRQKKLYSDFSISGMVALSKGRFMHFGHKINLFRVYNSTEYEQELNQFQSQESSFQDMKNMIFTLTERKQLKTNEIHYFDSPWFGSIVKITEYTGEKKDEQTIQ